MFKITEESLEQEVANYLKSEFIKSGLKCDTITQATPISHKKKKGEQFDILLHLEDHKLVIELKIGKSLAKFAKGVAQANAYKDHLGADGILTIMYPEDVRKIAISQEQILQMALKYNPQVLLLSPFFNDFHKEISLSELIQFIRLKIKEPKPSVSISLVVHTLRDCVQALSARIRKEKNVLESCIFDTVGSLDLFKILTEHDKDLSNEKKEDFSIFASDLSSYILINQLLLYHILMEPLGLTFLTCLNNFEELKDYFNEITDINYKAVYQVSVLDSLPPDSLTEVNTAILALKAIKPELIPHDLLGRLLHEFLPFETRKHFGTFYTKPVAAEFLAQLSIDNGNEIVFDPACGSGTLLVAAYNRKRFLSPKKSHKKIVEEEIVGIDVMPFAAHLSALNLTIQERVEATDKTQIGISNSLSLELGSSVESLPIQFEIFSEEEKVKLKDNHDSNKIELVTIPDKINTIIMNPPFTRKERLSKDMKGQFDASYQKPQNYWAYFLALSDSLIDKGGKIAAVVPRDFFKGQFSKEIRRWLFSKSKYNLRYVLKTTRETGFSENAQFRDFLVVLEKKTDIEFFNLIYLKQKLEQIQLAKIKDITRKIHKYREEDIYEDEEIIMVKIPQYEVKNNYSDLWRFVGSENPKNAKTINTFFGKFNEVFSAKLAPVRNFNFNLLRGLEPKVKNLLNAVFIVRPIEPSRVERSQLIFQKERKRDITFCLKGMQIIKSISKESVYRGLKTASYLDKIAIDSISDFLIVKSYRKHKDIEKFLVSDEFSFEEVQAQADKRISNLVISRRINLVAPGTKLIAFSSEEGVAPGKAFWSLICDSETSKILSIWINTTYSLLQILLKRTETEGGWSELTKEDLYDLMIPNHDFIKENKAKLLELYELVKEVKWPSIVEQLKNNFPVRKELDARILKIIGFKNEDIDLLLPQVYKALLNEFEAIQESMSSKKKIKSNQLTIFSNN